MRNNNPDRTRRPGLPKKQGGVSWGFAGLAVSTVVALLAALLFVLLSLAGLDADASGSGQAYAGLAVIFIGVLIFLAILIGLGFFLLVFFIATHRKQAMFVSIAQVILAVVLLLLFFVFLAM